MIFADSAARLAALAAQALGWRPHEFWAATPAELALSLGTPEPGGSGTGPWAQPPPTRSEILALIERDADGRSD